MPKKNIILVGFRAVGKTTVGKVLAEDLGWTFFDMDKFIETEAGMTIPELTKNGAEWFAFRDLEFKILRELMGKKNVVISCGGGVGVNNIPANKKKTFGELETEFLQNQKDSLTVLLTADRDIIKSRLLEEEFKNVQNHRPSLNPENAKKIELTKDRAGDVLKIKEIADLKNEENMGTLEIRKPLYAQITDFVVDTGESNIEESVQKIKQKI